MPSDTVRAAAPGLPAAQTTSADPMLDMIARWRDSLDRFNAESVGPGLDENAEAELAAATWQPVLDEMVAAAPRTATHAGALAAIELVARDIKDSTEPWHGPFLASALAFLKQFEPKERGAAATDPAPYAAKAFEGPGYYVFDGHEHPMLAERDRVWRVEAMLPPPLPPEEVLYEIYAVGGSADELALILPPRAFDAAEPRRLGATIPAAIHALMLDTESDLGTAKTLNHALSLVGESRGLGIDKDEDREVFCYLSTELRDRLEAIDECHNRADKLAIAAREAAP